MTSALDLQNVIFVLLSRSRKWSQSLIEDVCLSLPINSEQQPPVTKDVFVPLKQCSQITY